MSRTVRFLNRISNLNHGAPTFSERTDEKL